MRPISIKHHRFPLSVILHAARLYARITLSFRDVEEALAERGVDASNETVRQWFLKFDRLVACNLRRSAPQAKVSPRLIVEAWIDNEGDGIGAPKNLANSPV